jgi:hypothetical protein
MTTQTYIVKAGGKATIRKDPNARKLYGIDLTDVLAEVLGRTISSAQVVTQTGVAAEPAIVQDAVYVLTWVTGGTVSGVNLVTFRVTFSDGSIDDYSLYFDVAEK